MKQIIAYPVAWSLFYLGNLVSYFVELCPSLIYPVYNNLMYWSLVSNDWAELNVWFEECPICKEDGLLYKKREANHELKLYYSVCDNCGCYLVTKRQAKKNKESKLKKEKRG